MAPFRSIVIHVLLSLPRSDVVTEPPDALPVALYICVSILMMLSDAGPYVS
jgi:hypothetical protein